MVPGRSGGGSGSLGRPSPRTAPPTTAATPSIPAPTNPTAPTGRPIAQAEPAPTPATTRLHGSFSALTARERKEPAIFSRLRSGVKWSEVGQDVRENLVDRRGVTGIVG